MLSHYAEAKTIGQCSILAAVHYRRMNGEQFGKKKKLNDANFMG